MFKTLRPTAMPLFQAFLACGLLVCSALALAAPAKPPLDLLFRPESRLVLGTLVEKNPAGRLVFKREKVFDASTDVPELIDVRAGERELAETELGRRYVLGYSLFHHDRQYPRGIAPNRKGAILISSAGLDPALFPQSTLILQIVTEASRGEGRQSPAMKRLLMKAIKRDDARLQLLAAGQFAYKPALAEKLTAGDRQRLERLARDPDSRVDVRAMLLAAAAEQPAAFGNWAGDEVRGILASTPLDGYSSESGDPSGLVLLAFSEASLHHIPVPYDSIRRWLRSPQRSLIEKSTFLLGEQYPARQRDALGEALGDSSISRDTRQILDDQLRFIDRQQQAASELQQQGPG